MKNDNFFDINSEIEIIAILMNESKPETISDILFNVTEKYFSDGANKKIYQIIKSLYVKNISISSKSVLKQSIKKKQNISLEKVVDIDNFFLSSRGYQKILDKLKEKYMLRESFIVMNNLNSMLSGCEYSAMKIIDETSKELSNIALKSSKEKNDDEILSELLEQTKNPQNSESEFIKFYFMTLDKYIGGFPIGEMSIIAARPAVGKSAFAMELAKRISQNNHKAGIISLEMTKKQLFKRLMSNFSKINSMKLGRCPLNPKELTKVTEAIFNIKDLSLTVDDTPGLTVESICRKLRMWKLEKNIDIAFIDYLQFVHTEERFNKKNDEVSHISRLFKEISKELDISVVCLSQLNRNTEMRSKKDRKPMLSDLRDSGSLEQDAALVLFLHEISEGKILCFSAKNRHGGLGNAELEFTKKYQSFEEYHEDNFIYSED